MLDHHNWREIKDQFESSAPRKHAIIDNFLPNTDHSSLHSELRSHAMWRFKNPQSRHLHNHRPKTTVINSLIPALRETLVPIWQNNIDLIDYWALMYQENTDGNIHADFGRLTLTYWITPEQYNLDMSSGGLLLFDAFRQPGDSMSKYLKAGGETKAFVAKAAKQPPIRIPYKGNRAVLFDPRIYHKSDRPHFDIENPLGARINLTFSFHDPLVAKEEMEAINRVAENV